MEEFKIHLPDAIDAIRPCVVQILFSATGLSDHLMREEGRPIILDSLGTGFFINTDGYVITANHVIEEGIRLRNETDAERKDILVGVRVQATQNVRNNFTLSQVDIVARDELHDLSLLKLQKNPFSGELKSGFKIGDKEMPISCDIVNLNPRLPREGDKIGVSGYPYPNKPALVTNSGSVATILLLVTRYVPRPGLPSQIPTPRFYEIHLGDIEINPGNSGGPVYLVNGSSVIGVCVSSLGSPTWFKDGTPASSQERTIFYSSGLTTIIPTTYIIELLARSKVKWGE